MYALPIIAIVTGVICLVSSVFNLHTGDTHRAGQLLVVGFWQFLGARALWLIGKAAEKHRNNLETQNDC